MKPRRLHIATTSSRLGSREVSIASFTGGTVTTEAHGARCHTHRPMPIYEYRCRNGHSFEVMQSMSDDPVSECEQCAAPVERVFHPVAVHFKGSGFYTTDYAKKGSASKPSSDGGESKAESKPESKSESKAGAKSNGKSGSNSETKAKDSSGG